MAPQFVDFNADGQIDIVTATFDGSPHVSLASSKGFAEPHRLLDTSGKRIMLSQFWNYKEKKWDENSGQPKGHCTSAVAFDWDNDGDHDLILGSYGDGNLYLQMNEGTAKEPKFTGKNIALQAGDKPFALDKGVTAPRLVDWNNDGLMDLLCGSYGDGYGNQAGGGVYVYLNEGKLGAPKFASAETLIPASPKGQKGPTRPDTGLFADAVDYDGDGDLDLIVGGYSTWSPEARELTKEEEARLAELEAKQEVAGQALNKIYEDLQKKVADLSEEEQREAYRKLSEIPEFKKQQKVMSECYEEISKLRPASKREAYVWLYRRAGVTAAL